jgi:DNA-binding MurR/RpiR family transcriptional regulator
MELFGSSVKQIILSIYDSLTASEQKIADYFLQNHVDADLSAKVVASRLFVSMASLTRFAKKCGFQGYREFVYEYSNSTNVVMNSDQLMRNVLHHYQQILTSGYRVMDAEVLHALAKEMGTANAIFLYGIGSSGIAAYEMQYRFMRLGISMQVITDTQTMKMNRVNFKHDVLLIAFSMSGNKYIMANLKIARVRGAKTALITTVKDGISQSFLNYDIVVPSIGKIEIGNVISPVLPALLAIDMLYAYSLLDAPERLKLLKQTVSEPYKQSLN